MALLAAQVAHYGTLPVVGGFLCDRLGHLYMYMCGQVGSLRNPSMVELPHKS